MAKHGMTRSSGDGIKVIGLTGGTGSGKTSVARMLARRGGYVIDADEISRDVLKTGHDAFDEVVAVFGSEILGDDQEIDRKRLGEIVFSDPNRKNDLEAITHKYILTEIKTLITTIKSKPEAYEFIVLDAPLLIECGLDSSVDTVWLMHADKDIRQKRITTRDSLDLAQVKKRIDSQSRFEELKPYADEIIDNNGNLEDLENCIAKLLSRMGEC